jgi:uncharacterized protein with PQ loop repeat
MIIEIIGLIFQIAGSILLLGGYAPQIIKLHRTRIPTGISLLFWTMIGTGCTSILINMIIQGTSIPVMVTQALNMICAWYTLGLVIYCKNLRKEKIKVNYLIVFIYLVITVFLIMKAQVVPAKVLGDYFQLIGTIALLTAYLPQIIHLLWVRNADGISKWLFVVLGTGLLCVTINMIITSTAITIICTEFVNIALIFVQYILTDYYQSKTKVLTL